MTLPAPRQPHDDCYCPACRVERRERRIAEKSAR